MKEKFFKKKENGFSMVMVVIMIAILTTVLYSVTTTNIAASRNIVSDIKKNEAYNAAYAGLQTVYAALNTKHDRIGGSILENSINNPEYRDSRWIIGSQNNYEDMEVKDDRGYNICNCKIKAERVNEKEKIYYRIVSVGLKDKSITGRHKLTMFVFVDDPNNPKIYDGDKKTIEREAGL